jgi:diacylglycerol kinase (ATP)
MTHSGRDTDRERRPELSGSRRSAWRRRLIDAERGIALGIRTDSTQFVHLFIGLTVVVAGMVLGLGLTQWAIVSLSITLVLSAEMFNQMLKLLWKDAARDLPFESRNAIRVGTGAVLLTTVGASLAVLLVFAQRIREMQGK